MLIGYPSGPAATAEAADRRARTRFVPGSSIGVIGAGGFARRTLMPLARRHGLELARVATSTGLSAASAAEQFGFTRGASSLEEVLADDAVAGVVIATRHDLHAELTLEALRAGKAVLVEKPLCLTSEQLTELRAQLLADGPPLMVGFNRRYAPQLIALREHLDAESGPTNVVIRVNAGPLPADHWLNDPQVGGGRLLGEGCHFLDLLLVLAAADPVAVSAQARPVPGRALQSAEDFVVSIRFADGSLGTLLYGTTGAAVAGKELVEASRGDRTGRIDDFRTVRLWGGRGSAGRRPLAAGRGKGHSEEMRAFAHVVRGELLAPPVDGYLLATEVTLAALASLQSGVEVRLQQVDE